MNILNLDLNKKTAQWTLVTPVLAEAILDLNSKNRKKDVRTVSNYSRMMSEGIWKENGEAIIIGSDGVLKDGQHRLNAVISSGHSYNTVVVTGVDADSMSTIDTGKNRSASDILSLNGIPSAARSASVCKKIITNFYSDQNKTLSRTSNKEILEYALNNTDYVQKIISIVGKYYSKSNYKEIFSFSDVAFTLHLISGGTKTNQGNILDIHEDFIKELFGITLTENSACYWISKTLLNNKKKGVNVAKSWRSNAMIKCWNIFKDGNIPVSYLKVPSGKIISPELI